jgi:predicted RNA-binding protein associated with RNAse of E/G family
VGDLVCIEYIRPGKEVTYYEEEYVAQDECCLQTYKTLPEDIVERLSRALLSQGLIQAEQHAVTITKLYFFHEPFNVLEFRDEAGNLLGHYSDIGEPVLNLGHGQFQMTDLYLDIWLFPNGRLLELDWGEFQEAIQKQVITTDQAELARTTMQRLVAEVAQGIYPHKYLDHFDSAS